MGHSRRHRGAGRGPALRGQQIGRSSDRHREESKRYGSIRALVDLDLSVNCGEIFGFLGPNGAGKSTTIRLLLGYLRPTSGSAAILGLDTQRQHIEIVRRVGYLPSYAVFEEVVTGLQALDDLAGVAGAKA